MYKKKNDKDFKSNGKANLKQETRDTGLLMYKRPTKNVKWIIGKPIYS